MLSFSALCTALIDIQLEDQRSGYFLKPLFGGQSAFGPTDQERHFVVTQARGPVKVKAEYGPYKADAVVSPELLAAALGNESTLLSNTIIDDMDVSAHLVTRSITQERPQLQVLFHASQTNPSSSYTKTKTPEKATQNSEAKWCMQVHATKADQELSAACILERGRYSVCVAALDLPPEWWDPVHTQSADVFYSVYSVADNTQCSTASGPLVSEGLLEEADRVRSYVGAVTLTHGQMTYQEVQEDQHILVYVPQNSFYPGSQFRVPIKLQAESDLQVFVVRYEFYSFLTLCFCVHMNPHIVRLFLFVLKRSRTCDVQTVQVFVARVTTQISALHMCTHLTIRQARREMRTLVPRLVEHVPAKRKKNKTNKQKNRAGSD